MIKRTLLYGSIVWSKCSGDNIMKALKLQKRTAHVILADTRADSVKLFKKLNLLPFYDSVKIIQWTTLFKRLLDCPAYMMDIIRCTADFHTRWRCYSSKNRVRLRFNREIEGRCSFTVNFCIITLRRNNLSFVLGMLFLNIWNHNLGM